MGCAAKVTRLKVGLDRRIASWGVWTVRLAARITRRRANIVFCILNIQVCHVISSNRSSRSLHSESLNVDDGMEWNMTKRIGSQVRFINITLY